VARVALGGTRLLPQLSTIDTPSGDEGTEQMEDSSAQSAPYLRGPTSLPSVSLPDRRPLVHPVGRR
jgi:hypothetical protein